MIEARLEHMGIDMVFGKAIAGAVEHTDAGGNITGTTVQLADGSAIETELLVLNIGTRAATGILNPEQVHIERGIVVDERMRTSAEVILSPPVGQ